MIQIDKDGFIYRSVGNSFRPKASSLVLEYKNQRMSIEERERFIAIEIRKKMPRNIFSLLLRFGFIQAKNISFILLGISLGGFLAVSCIALPIDYFLGSSFDLPNLMRVAGVSTVVFFGQFFVFGAIESFKRRQLLYRILKPFHVEYTEKKKPLNKDA